MIPLLSFPMPRRRLARPLAATALVVVTLAAPDQAVSQGAPPTEPSRATVVRGRVVRPAGVPVIGATVELFETEERATSDSTGAFLLRTTWTGPATLVARFVGDPPVAVELRLPLDSALTLVLPRGVVRLAEFTVLPPGEFRLANATRTEALTPLDVVQTPGAAGDVVRALQLAPGVGNVDEGNGLFVRGGDVTETRVLVDDVVMLSPARFANPTGHVTATVDPFLLAHATLSAGAFSAAHGNALSGIVRLETAGRPTQSSSALTASIGNLSAQTALAVHPRFGVRAQAGLSSLGPLQSVFGAAQPFDPPPRGGDAAMTLEFATGTHSRLRLVTLRQEQDFGVGAAGLTRGERYAAEQTEGFTVLSWRDTTYQWRPTVAVGRSRFVRHETLPTFDLSTRLASDHIVATVQRAPGTRLGVSLGVEHERFTAHYRVAADAPDAGVDANTPTARTGAHAELVWRVAPWAQLTTGLRADRSDFTQRTTVDPRAALGVQRGPWGVVASIGAYHQIPEPVFVRAAVATPMRVVQGTLAVERGQGDGARIRIEAYARRWRSLAQFTPDFAVVGGGIGEAVGVDSELRWQWSANARARLVWSVIDAQRTDPRTGLLATAPTSITHSVAWLGEREIGRLSVKTALRYATGRPFTDIVGRTVIAGGVEPQYEPQYGPPNGARVPNYLRSDVSVSRLFVRRSGPTVVVWAALSNVFDRRNIMRYTWNAEFSERTPVRSPFNRSVYAGATLLLP